MPLSEHGITRLVGLGSLLVAWDEGLVGFDFDSVVECCRGRRLNNGLMVLEYDGGSVLCEEVATAGCCKGCFL